MKRDGEKDMKTSTDFWKDWWNEYGKSSSKNSEVDRGTKLRIDKLEEMSDRQFLEAIDPQPTDRVLDVGCGTGVNFGKISDRVAEITGIDLSEEMIKRAERRVASDVIPNVRLLIGNVTHLEFPTNTFDKVICTSVLQYLNDDECETALKEMVRVSKNGAIIVIHLKNRTSLYGLSRRLLQFVARLMHRRITPDYYRPLTWYEHTISKVGGRIIDYDSFGIFTLVKLPQSIVRYLLQMELLLLKGKWFKKYGVNYKMTVRID